MNPKISVVIDSKAKAIAAFKLLMTRIDNDGAQLLSMEIPKESRSQTQNRLSHVWYRAISDRLGMSNGEARAYCKLILGVPILRRDSQDFRIGYDKAFKPLAYEQKVLIVETMDFPVTRLMNQAQMNEYFEAIQMHFSQHHNLLLLSFDDQRFIDWANTVGNRRY